VSERHCTRVWVTPPPTRLQPQPTTPPSPHFLMFTDVLTSEGSPNHTQPAHDPVDTLVGSLGNATLVDGRSADSGPQPNDSNAPHRPVTVYTRRQLLRLAKSPHIRLPDGMPKFKEWFGWARLHFRSTTVADPLPREWNEQAASKKDGSDNLGSATTTRDRRYVSLDLHNRLSALNSPQSFRRDGDEAGATNAVLSSGNTRPVSSTPFGSDPASRASYRSTLTQPSQMGNFKHQSLRSSERDKDKEGDRDRDREGQERLRNVSVHFCFSSSRHSNNSWVYE
jgi:zinc finger CCCH domain-containing protein 13